MRIALAVLIVALTLVPAGARPGEPLRPAHTYSIVARDPASGDLGVAVQSHWFAIGTLVPWADAGVGAVATQSFVEVRYGASGLDLMRAGWSASAALAALKQADAHPDVRQVAMIDAQGRVAVHTGAVVCEESPRLIIADVDANLGEHGLCLGDDPVGQVLVELLEVRSH